MADAANPLTCLECRPIYQAFRKVALTDTEVAANPEQRRYVIGEYMRRVHAADHDEEAVLAELEREHAEREERRREFRMGVMLWLQLRREFVGELDRPAPWEQIDTLTRGKEAEG